MSNRAERRRDRQHAGRRPERVLLPLAPAPRAGRGRPRRLGFLLAAFTALAVLLTAYGVAPQSTGAGTDPSALLRGRMASRGITVERLDAASLAALEARAIPAEEVARKALGSYTGATITVQALLASVREPDPADGSTPVVLDRDPVYVFTIDADAGGALALNGGLFETAVIIVDPYTGNPVIGAGFTPISAPVPVPSAAP
jgi:hypothetical protein